MGQLRLGRFAPVVAAVLIVAGCGARSTFDEPGSNRGPTRPERDAAADSPSDAPADVTSDVAPNDATACGPSNCGGCCDDNGTCRAGLESAACGAGGDRCVDCTAQNASCNPDSRLCETSRPCGPVTCPDGCCTEDGQCVSGTANAACGSGGKLCSRCMGNASECNPSTRVCEGPACGPATCPAGCCQNGSCQAGNDATACGVGGQQCRDCTKQGMTCDSFTHACSDEECGPWNCTGCCEGAICREGASNYACGGAGQQCTDCSAFGLVCDPNERLCQATVVCNSSNCDGCCDPASGQCLSGIDPWACGSTGQVCQKCIGAALSCESLSSGGGECLSVQPDCGPQTCPGCCDCSDPTFPCLCVAGYEAWACGNDGQVCQDCSAAGQQCTAHGGAGGTCELIVPPGCGPHNCMGCCDNSVQPAVCRQGMEQQYCGYGGQQCEWCTDTEKCAPTPIGGGTCMGEPDCGPWNCPGCCSYENGVARCMPGSEPSACGFAGKTCQVCASNSECAPGPDGGWTCVSEPPPSCGPWNCNGCCSNTEPSTCQLGTSAWACGSHGQTCEVCTGINGGQCAVVPGGGGMCQGSPDGGACGPWNCQGCCDAYGNCRSGGQQQACGNSGQQCRNCSMQDLVCDPNQHVCVPDQGCGPWNCPGCCTPNGTCLPGNTDWRCGEGGAMCVNCTMSNSMCIDGACSTEPQNCPGPYGSCDPANTLQTPVPAPFACSSQQLQRMQQSCNSYPPSQTCLTALNNLQQMAPQCGSCVRQFLSYDGYYSCLEPFMNDQCDHEFACAIDCVVEVCGQCTTEDQMAQCQQDAFYGGACTPHIGGLDCYLDAINGPAAFCDQGYGSYGDWLRTVSNHYCGSGSP